ncbi:hypothetical protein SSP24_48480 [Streptomyces spinoverrucosus]|uniref:CdiI immunity protein domain-containing protein n=1 Tax=Streptomyces spinoverrucosus TaxID=284043 RepID=A0A4Y3VKX7_9ACTN|nr:hypothetical protein [Streptomyces spinoverrucosus]GEC07193.1 hypothetical protein SSP24_48480 [Streptomyces spinoverrucosus]GHB90381.1 hypothetical protein GCM10010397_73150 [Streptomyces spinoverrucosus]
MNRETEKFIKVYLSLEQAYDTTGYLRPALHAFKEEYVSAVRQGLETVLRTREISVGDYERLTDVEFEDDDALYEYLTSMCQYLFEAREKQPVPPN